MSGTLSGAKPEGVCHQCGERLSLVKRMKNESFCSLKCRNVFFGFDEGLALERLKPISSPEGTPRPLRQVPGVQPSAEPVHEPAAAREFAGSREAAPEPLQKPAPAREEIVPPNAGFQFELTARSVAVPNAFSEGAFGELPPLVELVRFPAGLRGEILWAGGTVQSAEEFLPWQDWEILEGQGVSMLQVAPHPLSTLGDPRFPVCGLWVAEFEWAEAGERLSTPPEARWVAWTWPARDCQTPLAPGEQEIYDEPVQMQLPVWLQIKRETTPGACQYLPLGERAKPAPAPGGIWPAEEDEVLTWRRSAPAVKTVSDVPAATASVDRGTEPPPARLAEAGWVGVPAGPRDDRQTASHRDGDVIEYSLEIERPGIPASTLDGELPGRPRVLPDEPAEMLFPFIVVDNTSTQSLRSWDQNTQAGTEVASAASISLGQADQWNRHLALPRAGVTAAPAAAPLEIEFHWPQARAMAAPLVCAFESRETWDVI